MKIKLFVNRFVVVALLLLLTTAESSAGSNSTALEGWLGWRGPQQNGSSKEKNLPDTWEIGGKNHLWDIDLQGRGTPVITGNKMYVIAYVGQGQELREVLRCLDASTGKTIWEYYYNDFLSDVIYSRYSIGAPTIDTETGNVYIFSTAGVAYCFSAVGQKLWEFSMFEDFGRIPSLPNGRTGAPAIDGDLVIVRGVSSNWGKTQGPGRDRFLALDKKTGAHVWTCTPGVRPVDSSFSTPVFAWYKNKRVFYSGTGCGNVVCVNVKNGKTLWRYRLSTGGVNSSVLLHNNKTVVAIHGKGNPNSTKKGGMIAIDVNDAMYTNKEALVLKAEDVKWRHGVTMFTSSPVLAGDLTYQVDKKGNLHCINVPTGELLWTKDLGVDQIHASPLYADGKLYVAMPDGTFYILKPSASGCEVLSQVKLEGGCLASPAVWNGRIYIHSKKRLYCFGNKNGGQTVTAQPNSYKAKVGPAVALQVYPTELVLAPGDSIDFMAYSVDVDGHRVAAVDTTQIKWVKHPKLPVKMNADFNDKGQLVVEAINKPSAGLFVANYNGLKGSVRGRVLPQLPFKENFEDFVLKGKRATPDVGEAFSHPHTAWLGARMKWEVRELNGNKVFAKTLFNLLFTKARSFIGPASLKNYTVQVDVMSEGNRRVMSDVGVINQRYNIALIGNAQALRITSNHDRYKVEHKFKWKAKTWYTLKTSVEQASGNVSVIKVKIWKQGEDEPGKWNFEERHKNGHRHGAPGVFGFAPQAKKRMYIDNISVYPNKGSK